MLRFLTLVFTCQFIGELFVGTLVLPVPGPVVGMISLFLFLLFFGSIPADLAGVSDGLLKNMSLLFVPAGTGVMMHFDILTQELMPISAVLVVSTIATIVVTALMMRWLGPAPEQEPEDA